MKDICITSQQLVCVEGKSRYDCLKKIVSAMKKDEISKCVCSNIKFRDVQIENFNFVVEATFSIEE